MANAKVYDTLGSEEKVTVNSIVDKTMGLMKENDKVNVTILKAVLEQLNEEKKSLKAQIEADAQAVRDAAKAAAKDIGTQLAKQLAVGDSVTFVMGSKKMAKTYTLPVKKVGDSSVTVEFTDEIKTPYGETGDRYILFSKITSIQKIDGTVVTAEDLAA